MEKKIFGLRSKAINTDLRVARYEAKVRFLLRKIRETIGTNSVASFQNKMLRRSNISLSRLLKPWLAPDFSFLRENLNLLLSTLSGKKDTCAHGGQYFLKTVLFYTTLLLYSNSRPITERRRVTTTAKETILRDQIRFSGETKEEKNVPRKLRCSFRDGMDFWVKNMQGWHLIRHKIQIYVSYSVLLAFLCPFTQIFPIDVVVRTSVHFASSVRECLVFGT